MSKKKLNPTQVAELLVTLQNRFEKNKDRHTGLEWKKVEERLKAAPEKLWSLSEMERTEGEPDVVAHDKKTGAFIFYDCSPESPKGRRSICYDRKAEYKTVPFIYFNMPVVSINDPFHRQHNNLTDWDRRNLYTETIYNLNMENKHVTFNEIINIDVLLYFISLFGIAGGKSNSVWVPHTSPMRKDNTSELMLKCTSKAFFNRVIGIFGANDINSFNNLLPKALRLKQEYDGAYEKYNLPESDFALYYQYINTQQ